MESGGYVKAFSIISSSKQKQQQLFISYYLVEEILSRTGQRTLMSCRSVCKSWKRMISDQGFMNRFITRLKTHPPLVTGFYYRPKRADISSRLSYVKFCLLPEDTLLDEKSVNTSLSFLPRNSPMTVISSHEGFLLCLDRPYQTILNGYAYMVCNPLTQQWVQLPKPSNSHHNHLTHLYCYENQSDLLQTEFKVVSFLPSHMIVETYTSNTGVWKSSTFSFPERGPYIFSVLFDGSIYFMSRIRHKLYAYDLKEENMRCIELPSVKLSHRSLLGVSAGSIYYAAEDGGLFQIWVHDDDIGWPLQHKNIDFLVTRFQPVVFHPLNPNVVLMDSKNQTILYHKDSKGVQFIRHLKRCRLTNVIPHSLPAWVPSLNNRSTGL